MSAGFQVFDGSGNLMVDINSDFCRYLGEGTTGHTEGSMPDAAINKYNYNRFWVAFVDTYLPDDYRTHIAARHPFVFPLVYAASNGTVKWYWLYTADEAALLGCKFIYGVY